MRTFGRAHGVDKEHQDEVFMANDPGLCPHRAHVLECRLPVLHCGEGAALVRAAVVRDHQPHRWTDGDLTGRRGSPQDRLMHKQVQLPQSPLAWGMLCVTQHGGPH